MLSEICRGLSNSLPGFIAVSPGVNQLAKVGWLTRGIMVSAIATKLKAVDQGTMTLSEAAGEFVGGRLLKRALKPVMHITGQMHWRGYHNVGRNRTWIRSEIDARLDGRVVKPLVIVYHDAYKAGKHIDIHLGSLSIVARVSGKPIESEIKYNSKGELTQNSKDLLLNLVRAELRSHARFPQNLDHSIENARCSWLFRQGPTEGYGSGDTRQVILEDKVEFYHNRLNDSSLHMYAPALIPGQGLYMYEIYPGDDKKVPIMIWGALIPRDENFKDRLHLKLIQEEDLHTKFRPRVDESTTTRKYDGASCYFTTTGQGVKLFSPRISKLTGHRIEYTFSATEAAETGFGPVVPNRVGHTSGMGEIMFWRHTDLGKWIHRATGWHGPENVGWRYLSAAEIGGVLNSNRVRPDHIYPEIRLYRMDRFLGQDVHGAPFFENRAMQEKFAGAIGGPWRVVQLVKPVRNEDWEGLVAVPPGASVNDGFKIKWWGDTFDWRVDKVHLDIGPKGAIAGVVHFTSLESGKHFKLGPGQIGSADDCMDMMDRPDEYVGTVAKVASRQGHEGRAAKLVEWHLDK